MSTNVTPSPLAAVRDVVAVHSAKGGVGKSTTAANLAVTYARLGLAVGLLDADVHGPSIAHMFGSMKPPEPSDVEGRVRPLERHGVRYLSLANVATDDAPIIWRGPMVAGAIQQLLALVDWGELDILLIDMPPGTGDALLGIGQQVTLSGVVVVTSPQEMSLADTRRGIQAFAALDVPILGIVENLSVFVCDACGDRAPLFGEGGGRAAAEALGLSFLGRIPIEPAIVRAGDSGEPLAHAEPESLAARAFESAARSVLSRLALEGHGGHFELAWEKRPAGEFRGEAPDVPQAPEGSGAPNPSKEPSTPAAPAPRPGRPLTIWQAGDDVLGILWDDGTKTFHGALALRTACPCAKCVDEWTGQQLPSLAGVPRDVRPVTISSVGRYAIQPVWSDGHRTGIFAFRDLRAGAGVVDAPR